MSAAGGDVQAARADTSPILVSPEGLQFQYNSSYSSYYDAYSFIFLPLVTTRIQWKTYGEIAAVNVDFVDSSYRRRRYGPVVDICTICGTKASQLQNTGSFEFTSPLLSSTQTFQVRVSSANTNDATNVSITSQSSSLSPLSLGVGVTTDTSHNPQWFPGEAEQVSACISGGYQLQQYYSYCTRDYYNYYRFGSRGVVSCPSEAEMWSLFGSYQLQLVSNWTGAAEVTHSLAAGEVAALASSASSNRRRNSYGRYELSNGGYLETNGYCGNSGSGPKLTIPVNWTVPLDIPSGRYTLRMSAAGGDVQAARADTSSIRVVGVSTPHATANGALSTEACDVPFESVLEICKRARGKFAHTCETGWAEQAAKDTVNPEEAHRLMEDSNHLPSATHCTWLSAHRAAIERQAFLKNSNQFGSSSYPSSHGSSSYNSYGSNSYYYGSSSYPSSYGSSSYRI